MGVSGSGKTTVGTALAKRLGWLFIEGDDFHPAANVAKMAAGHPLTDADRAPWLAALRQRIEEALASGESAVIACSALKHTYRSVLAGDDPESVRFVQLDVPIEVLRERLAHRQGHFMPVSLLESQLQTLESSKTALRVDGTQPVERIVEMVVAWLSR
jgi:carbohydrate kinase (thermoresistant glucokinase family)